MICYECQQTAKKRDAVALCHHCSAGLCADHALILSDPVTAQYPICKTIVLPLRARVFLCRTCREALRQIGESREGSEVIATTPTVDERDAVADLSRRSG
jgi:hypothetical protein